MISIKSSLEDEEWNALVEYAAQDVRPLKEQIRWIIKRELERRGYLKTEDIPLATLDVMEHNARHTDE